jgi:phenylpropionate dioxygenase-like ring-hydroxylating dioxygenase large terminal subunit
MRNGQYVVEQSADKLFRVNREVFVSEDVYKREMKAIFAKTWLYVGHASELKKPGDFVTRTIVGRPILFCRDDKGNVLALINSCRHRGAVVCRERSGNAAGRGYFCFYHGWTYGPDGSLTGVPGQDAYSGKWHKGELGMARVPRFESYRDFYFLNFDAGAEPLSDYLGATKEYIDLVVDQSPSGKMEIISGIQEYDVKANWKMLVENSVDDYHLLATHSTWMNYMRNSGVNMSRPRGLLLPSKGAGKVLGNGHLTTDNPNYRGRPVARWISVYGEDAKADIDKIRAELVQRLGEERAARVADTNRNLVVFPNFVLNDGSSVTVRVFWPAGPNLMKVSAWCIGPVEETPAQRARRLNAFLTFYGPGGFATPDDVAVMEAAQEGYASWKEVAWNDLSRGMDKSDDDQLNTDEGHLRTFWRRWSELVEAPR